MQILEKQCQKLQRLNRTEDKPLLASLIFKLYTVYKDINEDYREIDIIQVLKYLGLPEQAAKEQLLAQGNSSPFAPLGEQIVNDQTEFPSDLE